MQYLDLSLPSLEENLALDEALLECLENGREGELLRFWESSRFFIVLGCSSKIFEETNVKSCENEGIPILRRLSGGGTVLQGPGCLNFTLILKISERPQLSTISQTNCFILNTHRNALAPLLKSKIEVQGTSDLTVDNLKFSGNAQRRKRSHLLFHGTILYRFNISMINQYLLMPSRQPEYRRNRTHEDFVANVNLTPDSIKNALRNAWSATQAVKQIPTERMHELVKEKYSKKEWNYRF